MVNYEQTPMLKIILIDKKNYKNKYNGNFVNKLIRVIV